MTMLIGSHYSELVFLELFPNLSFSGDWHWYDTFRRFLIGSEARACTLLWPLFSHNAHRQWRWPTKVTEREIVAWTTGNKQTNKTNQQKNRRKAERVQSRVLSFSGVSSSLTELIGSPWKPSLRSPNKQMKIWKQTKWNKQKQKKKNEKKRNPLQLSLFSPTILIFIVRTTATGTITVQVIDRAIDFSSSTKYHTAVHSGKCRQVSIPDWSSHNKYTYNEQRTNKQKKNIKKIIKQKTFL